MSSDSVFSPPQKRNRFSAPRPRKPVALLSFKARRLHNISKKSAAAMPPPPGPGSNFRARALVRSGARIPPLRRVSISSLSSSSRSLNLPGPNSGRFAVPRVPIGTFAAGAAALGGMGLLGSGISR